MSQVVKSVLVPYTPAEMFLLVDGVEEYPRFLPWCANSELHVRNETITEATLHIGYMQVSQQFSTVNTKRFPEEMQLRLKSGPFKSLEGYWRFSPLGETACKINFMLQYDFSSHLLETVLGPVFGHIANTLVDAFVLRAEKVYGER
ncbi:MAG: ubiquinone-binding protein [Hydrogenophilales bacterium CG03_land_8_20_14_0_80_62_28]|nr:type II toxin-antitoxin system RatA family toxin [Betaproteobacteria bacterium]OIO78060.1 MAG: ubiquinone-binding protein [Hydrogenophilaceae bacterium CG1_02_62_390]PIV23849.1 MAG: ubiquinone-binding protein [Hydrogenophilales bacterium CG03_land_8_20_14_0_80_62_28]PIW37830.1 MAG: ubiquinone-binding protein [Hydrogenophilales bacterium CG15_BIG_FIL_POST_REV_8_21_14_020_62_31]PIW72403.1 MAG: ubiquinone-binding protein [Hydrogenophilales bacterium CG12_big_fil_rev_8_21_14_0_65_61_21]PIX01748